MLSQAAIGQQVVANMLENRVPVLGTIASGGVSFLASYYTLRSAINDISEDAARVLSRALKGCEQEQDDVPDPEDLY